MAKDSKNTEIIENEDPVCGIIMPISKSANYSAEHWNRVKKFIIKAVLKAGVQHKLAWEDSKTDIIQAKILKNIYDNDIIICDVSDLNPNVMLELGLRLSTKKPTIVITDDETTPPFDIGSFEYHVYPKSLIHDEIDDFISLIANKISELISAHKKNEYKTFIHNYKFEVIEPQKTSITPNQAMMERIDEISRVVKKLDSNYDPNSSSIRLIGPVTRFVAHSNSKSIKRATNVSSRIINLESVTSVDFKINNDGKVDFFYTIPKSLNINEIELTKETIKQIILDDELEELLS